MTKHPQLTAGRIRLAIGSVMAIVAILLLLIASPTAFAQETCPQPSKYSNTDPPINLDHIFCGEINKNGKAVGFHSQPGGNTPASVDLTGATTTPTSVAGVYDLRGSAITQGATTRTKRLSTMYPDHCTKGDVVQAILNAARELCQDDVCSSGTGSSGDDGCLAGDQDTEFEIQVYVNDDGSVNTAFPTGSPTR